jgi:hypothetical protein
MVVHHDLERQEMELELIVLTFIYSPKVAKPVELCF